MHNVSTVERAYELARSGTCANVDAIRAQLKRERFEAVDGHLNGMSIRRDLRALCAAATAENLPDIKKNESVSG